MKYNYDKMGQYSDNYENYVKEFQENCKNVYLKNTKIITISQEQMVKNTGGKGLAYTDGRDIFIPELTRNQNVITSDLKDKNLHAKLIRRGFVLHELAHFEEDNPSSFLRTIYLEVSNKALQNFDTKKLLENKNGEVEKFNQIIVDEVSKSFELHYGKTLSKENYKKYVGIYLNDDLRKKNTIFTFYNYWVDRFIENQLPLLARNQEDYRNVKSILHFLRVNMAKKELSQLSPSKADIKSGKVGMGLISKLAILTSNYVDPRTREMFEEAKHFDKDKDWKKYYQLNRDEIEKMYNVNKKLSNSHYGQYNSYIRNEKDIYSVHFNDAAKRIFDKLNDDFKEDLEEEKKKREQEKKEQQEKNKNKEKNQEPGDDEGEGEGEESESGQGGKGSGKGSGKGKPSPDDNDREEDGEPSESGEGGGKSKKDKGQDGDLDQSNGDGGEDEEEKSGGNGSGEEDEFSEEEMKDFKDSFKEDLNKKTDQEIMEEIINGFSEEDLRELLEEAAKKEQEALNKQNDESFGKDKIQDQKGKSEQNKPENSKPEQKGGAGTDASDKKGNPGNKKFEDTTFREHVNYKSSTVNDKTDTLNINKSRVNDMIIKFEKLISENREVKDLMNKAKELLKSSTTKQKKRMTSGSHKKIVDRAIRGDIKIFNKFVSFDLGDLDIFILIDNSGSMGENMKNAKIPFLQTRKDYSLFFCYLIKKIFEPLGANIDIKSFTTGGGRDASGGVHRSSGIVWENLQNIKDDDNTKRKNYDNIIQSKLNGAQSGTNLFAAFNEYVPSIRKHQYTEKKPILLFTVSDGDTGFETNEEKNHSIYLNNLIEKDASIKHIKLCINSMSLIKYFGATVEKTRYVQSDSSVVAIKNGNKTVVGKNLSAKNNTITIDGKNMGKSNDFSYIENFEDISKFMLENLDSIFNIILNNGKQVISNHKSKANVNLNKHLGPIM